MPRFPRLVHQSPCSSATLLRALFGALGQAVAAEDWVSWRSSDLNGRTRPTCSFARDSWRQSRKRRWHTRVGGDCWSSCDGRRLRQRVSCADLCREAPKICFEAGDASSQDASQCETAIESPSDRSTAVFVAMMRSQSRVARVACCSRKQRLSDVAEPHLRHLFRRFAKVWI